MTDASQGARRVEQVPTCFRHPDRETYVRCQRCGRHICPDCMRQASVGFHCPECVAEGVAGIRQARTPYGGAVRSRSDLVTKALIGLNVAVFLVIQLTGRGTSPMLVQLAMLGRDVYPDNANVAGGVADGGYWRLLTSVFVHAEAFHLLFNMVALWVFGPMLESLLGRLRFFGLYVVCGLAGSVVVYLLTSPGAFTVGASGAVFGLLGAALVVSIRRGYDVRWLFGLLAINAVITVLGPRISWQGHLGGLLAGLALGGAIAYTPKDRRNLAQWLGFGALLGLCLVAVVVRTASLQSLS